MLVLTRTIGERIVLSLGSDTVTIELLKIAGERARIGVDAPLSVAVYRQEVWDRITETDELPDRLLPLACRATG